MTWGIVGAAGVGLVGNALMSGKNTSAGNAASGLSQFKPTTINTGMGQILGQNSGGALTYSANPNEAVANQSNMFGGLTSSLGAGVNPTGMTNAANTATGVNQAVGGGLLDQAAANNYITSGLGSQALSAGQNFNSSANSALQSLGNFDPTQYSQNAYNQMASIQNAYNTTQNQNTANYEQESGRNGLTQNGELGDLGGVALAQGLTNNNLLTQSMQMGQNEQQLLGNQASQFAQTGSGQAQTALSNYLNSLTTGANVANLGTNQYTGAANTQSGLMQALLGGANSAQSGQLNIQSSLQNALNSSINASQGQAIANNNAANYGYQSSMQNNNNLGNLIGGMSSGLSNNGAFQSFGNWISGGGGGGGEASTAPYAGEGGD